MIIKADIIIKIGIILIIRLKKKFKLDANRSKFINRSAIYTKITAIRKYQKTLLCLDLTLGFILYIA